MTFLSKLGGLLAKGLAVVTGVWPLVSASFGASAKVNQAVTTGVNDLSAIGGVVVQAEALIQGGGTGAVKLAAAAPLVANIVKTSEMVSGHKIANDALFTEGCADLTSAIAKILNSLSPDTVTTSPGKPIVVNAATAQQVAQVSTAVPR